MFAAFEESRPHEAMVAGLDKALALFEAEKVDSAAVLALRAEPQAKMKKLGNAVVQALYDAHDALTPPQRKAIAAFVRDKHAAWQEHHEGGACPGCDKPNAQQ